jgi:DeoR/GlpR family transcriptional regulator of sugar metabolism
MPGASARIVVADSFVLGVTQQSRVAPIGETDTLITDRSRHARKLERLAATGLRVPLARLTGCVL